jgi:polysaccharide deacetylase family protein (PEP-CTERM system associated)
MYSDKENPIINVMTIDVEEHFQVSAFANEIDVHEWHDMESRVERNTLRILEIFSENNIQATFFVLGWVAEKYPQLVKQIANAGHEIASHGYSHQLIYNQEYELFKKETQRAKHILEEIIQNPVLGYRAASYSITKKSAWALDILAEAGFKYDSSIFPVHHDRYGMPDTPRYPYTMNTERGNTLFEFPLSSMNIFGYQLPIAGGGYFRLYPYLFSKMAFQSINRKQNKPFIFYMHPWEVDPDQPRIKTNWLSRFRHYNNLEKCEHRLTKLLHDFRFSTVKQVLCDLNLLQNTQINSNDIIN